MIFSVDIEKESNTFFIIKTFNRYVCYETCMGNVVKIQSQTACGSVNRISFLVPYLKRRDKTDKFKLFYYEFNSVAGLKQKALPYWLQGRKNTNFNFEESPTTIIELSYKPHYDMIVRGPRMFFCIESNGNYFLYDDDFGNPLKADITAENGKSFILNSGNRANTLQIINSLSDESTVYSLKVTNKGIIRGNQEFQRFELFAANRSFEEIKDEKILDKTRSGMIKKKIQQEKLESKKS